MLYEGEIDNYCPKANPLNTDPLTTVPNDPNLQIGELDWADLIFYGTFTFFLSRIFYCIRLVILFNQVKWRWLVLL